MNAQKQLFGGFLVALLVVCTTPAVAQRGGDDDGGRGGFRGGPPGGFRGGPPGGGFPGGGPPGGGFRGGSPGGDRGGAPGGDRGGRGGDRGGRGGDRGGFDPSSFLSRLDRNGNGTIDPDEQQGPAQFLIQRLQSADPSIKPGQPISIKRVTDAFQKMREGGGRDSSRGSSGSDDDGLTPDLLVPGFGAEVEEEALPTLLGFGAAAEMMSVAVTDKDREEARNTIRRYDRNRNGVLDKNEITSRFSGNPLDFDRNKDGRLTENELAVRYARRRETTEDSRRDDRDRRRDRDRDSGDSELVDVYGGRKSYRVMSDEDLPKDLPGYFAEKDKNRDGQIEMAEFAEKWDDDTVADFFRSDLNRDGVITIPEAYQAVEENASATTMASTSSGSDSSSNTSAAAAPAGKADDKMIGYAERIIGRYDKNNDKQLVKSEYEKMLMSPVDADANKDGIITVNEYALWMQSRRSR
ncbi:EF-hand domain-containing protein [Roseiconus lacunae]|uniref:EF-hand domain-containing protein n=1 Tax=Roseiconus lacunae TaxID=2605694 RepID=A0ABT7PEK4_9BACT|nr:EF-hand domain-containing protein [Roseiconus lacunae]MDM4014919.1 EF-hand domain-containing protein [Roseiconus lacunae]